MKRVLLMMVITAMSLTAAAEINDITGNWTTVDDRNGQHLAIVTIYQGSDGRFYGKIARMLVGPKDLVCEACEGKDHNAPIEGLVILRGMQYDARHDQLVGGKLLDPESGKFYYGKIYPKNGKLVLRGSLDKYGVLGRNQTWIRE